MDATYGSGAAESGGDRRRRRVAGPAVRTGSRPARRADRRWSTRPRDPAADRAPARRRPRTRREHRRPQLPRARERAWSRPAGAAARWLRRAATKRGRSCSPPPSATPPWPTASAQRRGGAPPRGHRPGHVGRVRYGARRDYGCMVQATDPVIDDLLKALHRVIRQTKRTVHSDTVERAAIIILSSLKENSAVRLSDLASDLFLDISTVSRQARALEDRGPGHPHRRPRRPPRGPPRARPAGLAVLDEAWSRRNRWLADSLHDWTPEDRVALVAMLTRFADSLSAEPAPRTDRRRRHPRDLYCTAGGSHRPGLHDAPPDHGGAQRPDARHAARRSRPDHRLDRIAHDRGRSGRAQPALVGRDGLPAHVDSGDSPVRQDLRPLRASPGLHLRDRGVRRRLDAGRAVAVDVAARRDPGDAGAGRRRPHGADVRDHRRHHPAPGARPLHGLLHRGVGPGQRCRTAARRVLHRASVLALDLLHQRAAGRRGARRGQRGAACAVPAS